VKYLEVSTITSGSLQKKVVIINERKNRNMRGLRSGIENLENT